MEKIDFKSCFRGSHIETDFWLKFSLEYHLVALEGVFGQNLLPTYVRRIIYQAKALGTRKTIRENDSKKISFSGFVITKNVIEQRRGSKFSKCDKFK